ncbi:hypothetical protein CAPTEDRAFT_225240 [Capitella teleta]|uniref:RIIa domain-containing protein n=1 Tax=Capitella teleta TaxID=283909 RepID=R7UN80_CAPTE|nr:hypothetical protein CAPTEDRAFT_225240 [Capitella teleta]|eukprot:ELU05402.1 hypothetical protein CAPTEDRAFT_225240 [Capitella teleta]
MEEKFHKSDSDGPEGMEHYDGGALSEEQKQKLSEFKRKTRQNNEQYMRQHPEVACLLTGFLGEVLVKRPDNIRDFAADFFTDGNLPEKLQVQLEHRKQQLRENKSLRRI